MSADALQPVLAAEHATLWVLSALAARVSEQAQPTLRAALAAAYDEHRDRRDWLTPRITELGDEPAAAAPAYELPATAEQPRALAEAALRVERTCSAIYAQAVAETSGDDRAWAIQALTESAVRELSFNGSPSDFPGLDELTNR